MIKKLIFLVGIFIAFLANVNCQEVNKKKIPNDKLMEIRSNSRDIAPVRKTNLHTRHMHRAGKAINRDKRMQLQQKRMMMQKKRSMQRQKSQMRRNMQMTKKRAMHNKRR